MSTNPNCDPDSQDCLDALIKEINDDLTIACQVPFTVPKEQKITSIKFMKIV